MHYHGGTNVCVAGGYLAKNDTSRGSSISCDDKAGHMDQVSPPDTHDKFENRKDITFQQDRNMCPFSSTEAVKKPISLRIVYQEDLAIPI